ncbi:MAG: hypothetical protein ACAH88_17190 [Roseimicrobium sp.]
MTSKIAPPPTLAANDAWDDLAEYVTKGLGPRLGPDNLRRLSKRIRQAVEDKKPSTLLLLAKAYWLIARILGEDSAVRQHDIRRTLEEHIRKLPGTLELDCVDPALAAAGRNDCTELAKLLNQIDPDTKEKWWRAESDTPEQISPGPLWSFSQSAQKPARLQPVMHVSCTLNVEHPESLRKRNPWMYR